MNGISDLNLAMQSRFPIPKWMYGAEIFCITHYYNIGDGRIFIWRKSGNISPVRAAVYCQFLAEDSYGVDVCVSNFGIAAALIVFYGFSDFPIINENYEKCTVIDMFGDRERLCGEQYTFIMNDKSFHRDGLKQFLEPFIQR